MIPGGVNRHETSVETGDQRLRGFDGNTGALIFGGGGPNELMSVTERYNTGIAAHGRIYIATDNKVFAFSVPVGPIVLTNLTTKPNGAFQLSFSNTPGISFTAFATTNAATPFPYWSSLGSVPEISPGQFQIHGHRGDK